MIRAFMLASLGKQLQSVTKKGRCGACSLVNSPSSCNSNKIYKMAQMKYTNDTWYEVVVGLLGCEMLKLYETF